jgi:hypothetical protein
VTSWDLIGSVIGVTLLAALIVIWWRVQIYRIKHRPIDMDAVQMQILADLGLVAVATMKDSEIGVTVTVRPVTDENEELEAGALVTFQDMLLILLSERLNIPRGGGWVHCGPSPVRVFVVVFVKPQGHNVESFARDVEKIGQEFKENTCTLGKMIITTAAIALPCRTPREISRQAVLRIDVIGEGNFSEVFKGVLSEGRDGHMMKVVVAVKACHTTSTETARESLLKEAALTVRSNRK